MVGNYDDNGADNDEKCIICFLRGEKVTSKATLVRLHHTDMLCGRTSVLLLSANNKTYNQNVAKDTEYKVLYRSSSLQKRSLKYEKQKGIKIG